MDIITYKNYTKEVAIYPKEKAIEYLSLGLASEGGEVAGVVKKKIRDNTPTQEFISKMEKELGDVFWYAVRLCDELGLSPEEVLYKNIEKLLDRKQRDKLSGSGDDR